MVRPGWIRSTLALACAALLSVAAAQQAVIVSAYFRDVRSLDPAIAPGSPDQQLITNIFSGLVRYTFGSNDVEPDLATHWDVSEDGRTYTFYLRDDVQWHRGYGPFTAHDVKYSFERILDPEVGSRWRAGMEVIESIEVIDDHTVAITLQQPSAPFLTAILAFVPGYVVNQQAIEDFGDDAAFNPIGTGPFQFVSYEPRQQLVLEAFPDFYRGEPEVKRIVWNVVPDESVQALALQRGELNHMIVRDVEVWETLKGRPGITLMETPATGYWYYAFNTTRTPLDDVRVRQAIAHAVDKELFVETVLGGNGVVTDTVIAPGMFGHTPDVPSYPHDPERARELLAEAGYPDGFTINVVYNAGGGFHDQMAAVLQQWLGDIGVTLELIGLEGGAWTARRQTGDYDITISGITRADPDQILSEQFHSTSFPPGGINQAYYAEIDDLVEAQRFAVSPAERAEILAEIQRRIAEDVPELPLFAPIYVTAYADYITGEMPNTSNWLLFFDKLEFTDLSRCQVCR